MCYRIGKILKKKLEITLTKVKKNCGQDLHNIAHESHTITPLTTPLCIAKINQGSLPPQSS